MRRAAAIATMAAIALCPAAASADTLAIKIIEVNPGTAAGPGNGDFVELQMFAPGQNLVAGHDVELYDAAGNKLNAQMAPPFSANVAQGASQRSILIGDPALAPDLADDTLLDVPLAGGAACFGDTFPFDCVTWGSFAAQGVLPDPQTANAPALTAGSSLTRSIAPGCPTLLEDADDTRSSAADFALAAPTPRNNSAQPTEAPCGGPPPGDAVPPITKITKAPEPRTDRDSAKFRFEANEPVAGFLCSRDGKPFVPCASPVRYRRLDRGRHRFAVQAVDLAGNTDPSPARERWRVVG
jgi:hypothetical protein